MFGLFKKQKTKLSTVHLCPSVKGQILDNGKPVAGETVYRQLAYIDGKLREDQTTTNTNGEFYFPEINIQSDIPNNPFAEHRTQQVIYINAEKDILRLWDVNQPGLEPKIEFQTKLSTLLCDINNEEVNFEFKYSDHPTLTYYGGTICRWDKDFHIY